MGRVYSDDEIILHINNILEGTQFKLVSFERNNAAFGNMIVKIKSPRKKLNFITDRDDIFCNDKLLIPHGYHIAGEDDAPEYLVKAIRDTIERHTSRKQGDRTLEYNLKTLFVVIGQTLVLAGGFLLGKFDLDFNGLEIITGIIILALSLYTLIKTWKGRNDEFWVTADQLVMISLLMGLVSVLLFVGIIRY